ncbi:MAG TPA: GNAT family N-acetyltransferase [Gaiellaceae bacterium]
MRLSTDRLELVACKPELADALPNDRGRAEEILEAALPEGWPDEELIGLLPITGKTTLGYGIWVVVDPARGDVGSAGFVGDPQDGEVELGYGIHPHFRGLGYATEASKALVDWALAQEDVRAVVAESEQSNVPSVRVLEKVGMARNGERGSRHLWASRATSS